MVEYKTEEDNSPEGKDTRMNEVKTPKKPLIFYANTPPGKIPDGAFLHA